MLNQSIDRMPPVDTMRDRSVALVSQYQEHFGKIL